MSLAGGRRKTQALGKARREGEEAATFGCARRGTLVCRRSLRRRKAAAGGGGGAGVRDQRASRATSRRVLQAHFTCHEHAMK